MARHKEEEEKEEKAPVHAFHKDRKVPPPPPELKPRGVDLEKFDEGRYIEKATGAEFGLRTTEPDDYGHTHHLRNETHSWSGRESDFEKAFKQK